MIRVYSIDNCPYCTELKNMYTNSNIEFININVGLPENVDEFNRLLEISKSDDVPIVKIGNNLLVPNVSFHSINDAFILTKKLLSL